ncbi:cupin domain-containing protein [Mycobacterium sp. HM-7]
MSYFGFPDRYPPTLYHGEDGEVSAYLRRTDTPPTLTYPTGETCEYLTSGAQSEGRFGLYRWTFGEEEHGPDAHFHRTITEHFYVLRGTVSLHDGNKWVTANPGDYLYVPAGGWHGFRGGGHAQMLLSFSPGGPREDYFETLATGGLDAMSADERQAFMDRHDTYWAKTQS